MEWFNGSIADAVKLSKDRNVIFVVFIDGKTDAESMAMNVLVNSSDIAPRLSNPARYLAIRIESQEDSYKQFAQIYRLVPVPAIFFIGQFGQPIEIVTAGTKTVEALQERIEIAEGIFYSNLKPPTATTATEAGSSTEGASGSTPAVITPTLDEKLALANKLIEKKRIEREEEEKRVQKERELERRKAGKDMGKMKQWQDDQELIKLKEERAREKAEEDEARRRVLEQIKMDRLQRQQPAATSPPKPIIPVARPMVNPPDQTRIQFRKPTGESVVDSFKSDGYFGDVWKYAQASVVDGSQKFVLATAMPPRREFSADDSQKTLIELNLAPSAVLLVIPLTAPSKFGGSASSSSVGPLALFNSFLWNIFWTVVTPLLNLWNRFKARNDNPPASSRPLEPASAGDVQAGPSSQRITSEILQKRNLSRYNLGPAASTVKEDQPGENKAQGKKPESNIHRLRDFDSDDKDNNTYNGNSTQQM